MTSKSHYRPLSVAQEEIRVLEVKPQLERGLVSCSLQYISLLGGSDLTKFDAVSWCWGNPTHRQKILLNGEEIEVPRNAEEVLRNVVVRNGISRVWLDAVCINQQDLEERASQVAIMDRIFSKAKNVIVWLGTDDGSAKEAIQGIEALVQHCRSHTNDLADYESTLWLRMGPRRGRYFTYDTLPDSINWQAVKRLYSVPYLTRLWIIQEISLAKRPICYYGEHTFSWFDLGVAAQWMIHRSYERDAYIGSFVRGIVNASIISNVKRGMRDSDKLLMSSVHFDTGEPRDKVWGLLGLIKSSNAPLDMRPDYKRPVAEIFMLATKKAICQHRRLWILGAVTVLGANGNSSSSIRLPSWAPQYANTWQRGPKGIRNFSDIGADNGKPMVIDEQAPLDVLRVQGIAVATAAKGMATLTEDVLDDLSALKTFLNELWTEMYSLKGEKSSLRDLYGALTTWYGTLPGSDEGLLADFNAFFDRSQLPYSDQRIEGVENNVDCPQLNPTNAFRDHLRISSLRRSFFVTTDGLVGQATAPLMEGDKVCILFGNDFPFVLRPSLQGYTFVGGAHLSHVMDGSYVRDREKDGDLHVEFSDIH